MKLQQGTFCPLIKKDCIGLQCVWFIQIRGTHPQTGEPVDEYDCSIKWLPTLLIDNTQQVRHHAAATESFRNEMVNKSDQTMGTMITIANHQLAATNPSPPNNVNLLIQNKIDGENNDYGRTDQARLSKF